MWVVEEPQPRQMAGSSRYVKLWPSQDQPASVALRSSAKRLSASRGTRPRSSWVQGGGRSSSHRLTTSLLCRRAVLLPPFPALATPPCALEGLSKRGPQEWLEASPRAATNGLSACEYPGCLEAPVPQHTPHSRSWEHADAVEVQQRKNSTHIGTHQRTKQTDVANQ